MKKFFSFFAALLFAGSMMAGSFTITFKAGSGSSDSSTKVTTVDAIISDGAANVSAIATADNVYNARAGRGVKLGTSSKSGTLTMTLAQEVKATSIVVNARKYNDTEKSFTIQGKDFTAGDGDDFAEATYTYESATSITSVSLGSAKRIYFTSVTVNFEGELAPAAVANYCQTEITHAMNPAETASAVLLSVGVKGEKTIVRIDKKNAEAANLDFLQVTPNNVGSQLEEGGSEALAIEINTPTPVNDSLTLEILWSTVGFPGNWMVQNLRVAVADCKSAVVPLVPMTCAEVYSTAKDDKVALKDVTVTYVSGNNVYVKDESGAMLLYLPTAATWKAGDKLAGVEGVVDVYHGLYEVKPGVDEVAAIVATAGDAPAPVELAVAPVAADINKYVILKNVSVATGEFTTSKATNLDLTIGEAKVVLRNNFKIAQVFDADAKYNIVATVAIYDETMQLYFISAEEIVVPQLNIFAYDLKAGEVTDGKVTIDYKLNAKATAVEIQLLDAEGAVKKTFDATGLKKGANQQIVDLAGVAAGTYNWAIKATAKPTAEMVNVLDYDQKLYNFYLPQGIAIDNSPESPFFGRIYVSESIDGQSDGATDRTKATKQGIFIYDPLLTDITNQGLVGYKGSLQTACSASADRVSFKRVVVDKDGYVYVNSLDANVGGVYRLDPANPKADLVPVLDTTKRGTLYAPISSILVEGQGEDKVLYTAENFVASAAKGSINKYAIGNATNFAGKADTVILNSSDYALGISDNQFVSDGRGGFWGCQHRWGYDVWSAVYHINANKVRDYVIMKDVNTDVLPQTSDVTTYRGVIAINEAKTLLAIPTKSRVVVYNIAYNAETGVPTLTEAYRTDAIFGTNIDGLAFDLAENLYVMSASKEKMFAFATVKAENNCTTPAAKASKIVVAGTGTAIDNSFVPAKVEKVIVNGQVLIIRDGKTYNMMGQTIR